MRLGMWGVRLHMVQPVQLCNPATVVGGHGDGVCSEVSVAGMVGNARAYGCYHPRYELTHLCRHVSQRRYNPE